MAAVRVLIFLAVGIYYGHLEALLTEAVRNVQNFVYRVNKGVFVVANAK